MSKELISVEKTKQLVEILYKEFISKIDINGIKWEYEFITTDIPNLCFKQLTGGYKTKQTITGNYTAELPFLIRYRNQAIDTASVIELSQPLYDIANVFNEEAQKNYASLNNLFPEGYSVESLQMTGTPSLDAGIQNGVASFTATYKLIYKVKGGQ